MTVRARALADAARLAARRPERVVLEVEDRGIGIRREDQQLIFEEFRQVDGGTHAQHGRHRPRPGAGQALRRDARRPGRGRVRAGARQPLPRPAAGRRLALAPPRGRRRAGLLRLPVAEARAAIAGRAAPPCWSPRTTTSSSARSPATSRRRATASCARATATRRWRSRARAAPAAITLDLVLPGRDGWEVLKELKADPATAAIPVIIVSLIANHELGFALGADDYFVKPLDRAAASSAGCARSPRRPAAPAAPRRPGGRRRPAGPRLPRARARRGAATRCSSASERRRGRRARRRRAGRR